MILRRRARGTWEVYSLARGACRHFSKWSILGGEEEEEVIPGGSPPFRSCFLVAFVPAFRSYTLLSTSIRTASASTYFNYLHWRPTGTLRFLVAQLTGKPSTLLGV